jgi:ORF6N domain
MELTLIQSKIYEVRGQKIMLDFDLASLYEVETKVLNQSVKRNIKRFPSDFMFKLTSEEWQGMRSQIVTASEQTKRNVTATPYAFTEQGLAMLSGILNSDIAINVNIGIMRAFVLIRQHALNYQDLAKKIEQLEQTFNKQFSDVYEALDYLTNDKELQKDQAERKVIGFVKEEV